MSLPANSLVDLSTFEFNFTGQTQHNGNASSSYNNNYVQTRFFPRNSASLIENLEIKINGQSRQNINQYGYFLIFYTIIHAVMMQTVKTELDVMLTPLINPFI